MSKINKGAIKRAATKLGIIDSLTIDMSAVNYVIRHEGTHNNDSDLQSMTADMVWEKREKAINDLMNLADVVGGTIYQRTLVIAR